ncbi:MAG: M81 family metallopeptidase [Rhodospirillaceae bacterium]|nr:M81 family metallopeptidase [Rhodospirillaceae bacterium]
MRVFAAALSTESNTFSPIPTDLESFTGNRYFRPGEHPDHPTNTSSAVLVVTRRRAKAEGFQLAEGTVTGAAPAGTTSRAAYETLRDEILAQLRAALPVDMVALGLHGAMVAHGYDDCEGDLLARARELAGPKAAIGATLDPHCHMTPAMLTAADVLICYKEFPHTDFVERAEELVTLLADTARGRIRPVMSAWDCRMIDSFMTSRQPLRGFVDRMTALEGKDGVLSVSIVHGFSAADVPHMGTKMLVVTDGRREQGDRLAMLLGQELFALRGQGAPRHLSPDEGIDRALALGEGTVVLADRWDNPGGGVAGDSTVILHRMLERGLTNAAIGALWDPIAVRFCHAAGEGAKLRLRFGGKAAPTSGKPVDAEVEITRVVADATQNFASSIVSLGDAAAIRVSGIDVVLETKRAQTFDPSLFRNLGIEPSERRLVVVKSSNHFYAGFAPIAKEIHYIDSGGPYPSDPRKVPYTRIPRPIWPIDENPHEGNEPTKS